MSSKPYAERTDLEKIESQWNKLIGFHERGEWSASIVRAATAAEIAANFVIREEFRKHSVFSSAFVDSVMVWANGLKGKMDHLILKFPCEKTRKTELGRLSTIALKINKVRNDMVHSGHFANIEEAREVERQARVFIEGLVAPYLPDFRLKPLDPPGEIDIQLTS